MNLNYACAIDDILKVLINLFSSLGTQLDEKALVFL